MMRITNKMMVNDLMRNINNNMNNMDLYQEQLSTGRKINKPSDDPAGIVKSLRLRTSLDEGEQYLANVADAINFMETTDASYQNINEVMQRIRELTVKAATGTNSKDENLAIAKEIGELNDQLKMVANATYGSKSIFSGTNVTEAPYQDGKWVGNEESLNIEISAGVKMAMNIPDMKKFFMGRLDALYIEPSSGIKEMQAENIQEGHYAVNTYVVDPDELPTPAPVSSTAAKAQSYLGSIDNNGEFFYKNTATGVSAASLGAGTAAGSTNSDYNASLIIEVKQVQAIYPPGTPRGSITDPTDLTPELTFDQAMYMRDPDTDMLEAIPNTNLAANFTYTRAQGSSGILNSADYVAGALSTDPSTVTFDVTGPAIGDTIVWNNDVGGEGKGKMYGADGKEYKPVKAVFDGTDWVYDDTSKVTVNIKGHVYDATTGDYTYIERNNVTLNMEANNNEALFTIGTAVPLSGDVGTLSTPLVIWNNSGASLGGIDPRNPQIAIGDKTVISVTAQQTTNAGDPQAERVDFGYTFLDRYGKPTSENNTSFAFQTTTPYFDNQTRDLKFFTLNEETGLTYDGSISLKTDTFTASDPLKESSFDYQAGIFSYVEDLCRKITVGKLPQVGNELAGNDLRLQEVLLYRATTGARVNRLELQGSRLTSTQENFTDLLSQNEDANEAEVIMNLQLQENVYRSSLAAGAKIIQPTLIDFLR
ncbi:MAG: flagellar hook-associated protein 3 [Firmicutes bacterium HGW-Firmicutes-15]|nr:MAG: flagellar hook-associated protein 3 [Firmicutes bacterium HGW-Firmicutes-15]